MLSSSISSVTCDSPGGTPGSSGRGVSAATPSAFRVSAAIWERAVA